MMQFGKVKLTQAKYGWMLHFGPFIGKCFELYGQCSESEVQVFRAFLKPGDVALDIGANIGDLTLPMARIVGDEGRIYAVESHSDTYHILCANLALNGIQNVKAINGFIADSPDVSTEGMWGKYGYVSRIWGASILPVDALDLPSCAFMKIDVDGKELEVLRSAAKLIERFRPVIYFENDDKEKSPALLKNVLDSQYDVFFHRAPIFDPDNFFGNPDNHWAPNNITSRMMLAIPRERMALLEIRLPRVHRPEDWWVTETPAA